MKKFIIILSAGAILIISTVMLLNINVTYKQGINYRVQIVRVPLYLKILDFFDRHFNYKNLVYKIINKNDTPQERVMKLFAWTHNNIKKVPEDMPIVDDHVWHIIVRGYGTSDQSNDVFTTLCNYAGVDAFFDFIFTKDQAKIMALSFVKLNDRWKVFDSYNGAYFKNKNGELANIGEIKNGDWIMYNITQPDKLVIDYKKYFENTPDVKDIGLKRANIQSPLRRSIFEFKKWIKIK